MKCIKLSAKLQSNQTVQESVIIRALSLEGTPGAGVRGAGCCPTLPPRELERERGSGC